MPLILSGIPKCSVCFPCFCRAVIRLLFTLYHYTVPLTKCPFLLFIFALYTNSSLVLSLFVFWLFSCSLLCCLTLWPVLLHLCTSLHYFIFSFHPSRFLCLLMFSSFAQPYSLLCFSCFLLHTSNFLPPRVLFLLLFCTVSPNLTPCYALHLFPSLHHYFSASSSLISSFVLYCGALLYAQLCSLSMFPSLHL